MIAQFGLMPKKRKAFLGVVVLTALLAILAAMAFSSEPHITYRRRIISWKFSGKLPYVTWPELMRAMLPGRWRYGPPSRADYVRGKSRGEMPCPVLWETRIGDFWGQEHDDITLSDLSHLERYQRGPVTIRAGDIVVDVGSQIGTFTRIALDRGAKAVVAIEPDAGNNACFKKTFENEIRTGRVILIEAALWVTTGTVRFSVASRSDAGAVSSMFDSEWGATRIVEIPSISLDDAVQKLNLPRVDFIKIAIGNGTVFALRGARRTLPHFRPRMVIVTSISPDDPLVFPKAALEILPSYHVFTRELEMAYFY